MVDQLDQASKQSTANKEDGWLAKAREAIPILLDYQFT